MIGCAGGRWKPLRRMMEVVYSVNKKRHCDGNGYLGRQPTTHDNTVLCSPILNGTLLREPGPVQSQCTNPGQGILRSKNPAAGTMNRHQPCMLLYAWSKVVLIRRVFYPPLQPPFLTQGLLSHVSGMKSFSIHGLQPCK